MRRTFRSWTLLLVIAMASAFALLACGQDKDAEFEARVEARAHEIAAELDMQQSVETSSQSITTLLPEGDAVLVPATSSLAVTTSTMTQPKPLIECRDAYRWYQRLNRALLDRNTAFDEAWLDAVNALFDDDRQDTDDWQPWQNAPDVWRRVDVAWHALMKIPTEFPIDYIWYRDEVECPAEGFGQEWYDLRDTAGRAYSKAKQKYIDYCTIVLVKGIREWNNILPSEWCELEVGFRFLSELEDSAVLYSDLQDRLE